MKKPSKDKKTISREPHELLDMATKLNVLPSMVLCAIEHVGNSRSNVEQWIANANDALSMESVYKPFTFYFDPAYAKIKQPEPVVTDSEETPTEEQP